MIYRRHKTASLREIGVIVSRPARLEDLLLSSHTPPSNQDTPASRDLMDYGDWEGDGMGKGLENRAVAHLTTFSHTAYNVFG